MALSFFAIEAMPRLRRAVEQIIDMSGAKRILDGSQPFELARAAEIQRTELAANVTNSPTRKIRTHVPKVSDGISVHVWTPEGFLQAGTLEMDEDGWRKIAAFFEYDREYLARANSGAYPLDPINMRLTRTTYATREHHVVLGAIFDAAPDAWGRKVIKARQLETLGEVDEALVEMLAGSWTIGGARPKAILRDDSPGAAPGRSLIAKFPSYALPEGSAVEWACLSMARDIGLEVPHHTLRRVGGEQTLLLDRFDRGPGGARRHYLSAMSLVSAMPQSRFLDSASDKAIFSWSNLLHVTSQVAARPAEARVQMFARLALNAALGNSDDHLKNYGFLKCSDDPFHYEVAPVFDITPQRSASHYLHCGEFGRNYTLVDVMSNPRSFGVSAAAASVVEESIRDVLSRRDAYFSAAGLSDVAHREADGIIRRGLGQPLQTKVSNVPIERQRG